MAVEKASEGPTTEEREGGLDGWLGGQAWWLDPVADFTQKVVGGFYGLLGQPGKTLKNLVNGVWPLGHPLHPALTDVPLGAWVAAVAVGYLSLFWSAVPAAAGPAALGVGTLAGLAAVAAGYTDFQPTYGAERRAGMLHGLVMTLVIIVMIVAFFAWISPTGKGAGLGLATIGLAIALFGAFVGGHLTFRFGTMVNRNAFTEFPAGWSDVGASDDFPENKLSLVHAAGIPVLLVRRKGTLRAIVNTCTHAGGPLNEGKLEGDIVQCPWHGSRFCVLDGSVEGGPATFPEPVYLVREDAGKVSVRAAHPTS